MQVRAKFLRVPPRKARLVANMIKGKMANDAMTMLKFMPKKGAGMIEKLLKSAVANVNAQGQVDVDNLYVEQIWVDPGPVIQAFTPRAQGRATPINKRTSHISLVLKEK
ncbi:50S ribosomal protein L22 [bacterium]|nr:50S ribosomal protein L22 [bacterium]